MSTHVMTEQEVQALGLGQLGGQAGAIVQHQPASLVVQTQESWSRERLDLLKRTYCNGATDAEFDLFIGNCKRLRLSPEARQIWSVARKNNGVVERTTQVAIDGFRLIAERTGKYVGQTPVQWCGKDGVWVDAWVDDGAPVAARVGVHRSDFKEPLVRQARLKSFVQYSPFWTKMPEHMIAKVAEALALRAAFPNELSGVFIPQEMGGDAAPHPVIDSRSAPEPGERGYNPTYNPAPDTKPDTRPARKAGVNPSDSKQDTANGVPVVGGKGPHAGKPMSALSDSELIDIVRQMMHVAETPRWAAEMAPKIAAAKTYAATRNITDFSVSKANRAAQLSAAVNDGVYRDDEDLYICLHPTLFNGQSIKTWDNAERLRDYRSWLLTGYNLEDKTARMERCERCIVKLAQIEQDRAEQALASQVPA